VSRTHLHAILFLVRFKITVSRLSGIERKDEVRIIPDPVTFVSIGNAHYLQIFKLNPTT
jgi:hypothetical protein